MVNLYILEKNKDVDDFLLVFNIVYEYGKEKEKWKESTYTGKGIYNNETGYKYIQDHLGYRLVLKNSDIDISNAGDMEVKLKIENVGFGNIVREKQIVLILKSDDNEYSIKSDIDIRTKENNGFYEFTISEGLPESIEAGNYDVYLNIQEPYESLEENDNYKIRLANTYTWAEEVGANYIGSIQISK